MMASASGKSDDHGSIPIGVWLLGLEMYELFTLFGVPSMVMLIPIAFRFALDDRGHVHEARGVVLGPEGEVDRQLDAGLGHELLRHGEVRRVRVDGVLLVVDERRRDDLVRRRAGKRPTPLLLDLASG